MYNLPAQLVDCLATFDFGLAADHYRAHQFCDQLPADDDESHEDRFDRLEEYHRALWRMAAARMVVADELARLETDREQIKDGVQAGWTARHERKVNHYPPASPDFSRAVSYACDAVPSLAE